MRIRWESSKVCYWIRQNSERLQKRWESCEDPNESPMRIRRGSWDDFNELLRGFWWSSCEDSNEFLIGFWRAPKEDSEENTGTLISLLRGFRRAFDEYPERILKSILERFWVLRAFWSASWEDSDENLEKIVIRFFKVFLMRIQWAFWWGEMRRKNDFEYDNSDDILVQILGEDQ